MPDTASISVYLVLRLREYLHNSGCVAEFSHPTFFASRCSLLNVKPSAAINHAHNLSSPSCWQSQCSFFSDSNRKYVHAVTLNHQQRYARSHALTIHHFQSLGTGCSQDRFRHRLSLGISLVHTCCKILHPVPGCMVLTHSVSRLALSRSAAIWRAVE